MFRKLMFSVALVAALGLFYVLFAPVTIDPVAWTPPPAPSWTGPYEPNTDLSAAKRLGTGVDWGPEDVAVDAQGRIYAGMEYGRIVRFEPNGRRYDVLAETGGRPLGLHFDAAGHLIVADADKGLLSVSPRGEIEVLSTQANGVPFRFTDDVDIGADGTIYFSDASFKYSQREYLLDILEHGANGRLLAYQPESGETRVLLEGLSFANGVAVSPDQSFVLVNETTKYRIRRYWLKGEKQGQSDLFIENLPGFPDGVSSNGKDLFWLAIFAPRDATLDALLPYPFLRKVLQRLPFLQPEAKRYGLVLGLDLNGKVVRGLHDPTGVYYDSVTSAQEHGGVLYLGSIEQDSIGFLSLR